jgi:uncharacterized glyoxalase superfamily metalloenzyme YdcJ
MTVQPFVSPDLIRQRFSKAMSDMYREEVPLYGALMELVEQTNREVLAAQPDLARQLDSTGEIERLDMERHGAIRVGTAKELATLARLFAVMGMQPVGYYDLTPAGCRCTPRRFARCMKRRCRSVRFGCSPHYCA